MAVVTRYFSTVGAGAADGTTWADRAELATAGVWSTVITAFDFTGSDSLLCLIGPGSYTIGATLVNTLFGGGATAPTAANPLMVHGCDSSGNVLEPPDPDWTSDLPAWDPSGLPDLQTTTNIGTINLANTQVRLIRITATGATTNAIIGGTTPFWDWIYASNSASGTSVSICGNTPYIANSVMILTGTSYAQASTAVVMDNCRLPGNLSASSGNRYGWSSNTAAPILSRCTIFDHVGGGVISTASSTSFQLILISSMILNNTGPGVLLPSTAAQTVFCRLIDNYIANNGTYGIDAQSGARVAAMWNRLRDNTTSDFNGFGNYLTTQTNDVSAGDDTEFVDFANDNFQISSSSAVANMGFGVSQQCASGGSVSSRPLIQRHLPDIRV